MAIVVSPFLTITDEAGAVAGGGVITADNPIIGYASLVTESTVAADTETETELARYLGTPSTDQFWRGVMAAPAVDEHLTLALNTAELVDYVGIAAHNFGSAQIPVSLEALDESQSPAVWVEIVSETLFADDAPILMRFAPQAVSSLRIRLQPGAAAPRAAVVYAGRLLVLQRRIYVPHTPIVDGRETTIASAKSESGGFLGRVVLSRSNKTTISQQNLTPAWVRTYLRPFARAAEEAPFFFAWRPSSYPDEVGYCWATKPIIPKNQRANGMMQIDISVEGVV